MISPFTPTTSPIDFVGNPIFLFYFFGIHLQHAATMKKHLLCLTGIVCAVLPGGLVAQSVTSFSQFFNNNNATFTDSESSLYNWNQANANDVSTAPIDISAGNTKGSGDVVTGEVARGRGFMFILPDSGLQPDASLMYTTHLGTSTVEQNNPQPDWFVDGPAFSFSGREVADIESIEVRLRHGSTGFDGHIGLQLDGSTWLFASDPLTTTTSDWESFSITDLTTLTYVSDLFDGSSVDADPSDNATSTLTGTEIVTGFALYVDTETAEGNDARIRMDQMIVTAVPEPATYAFLLGLGALTFVAWRRRR